MDGCQVSSVLVHSLVKAVLDLAAKPVLGAAAFIIPVINSVLKLLPVAECSPFRIRPHCIFLANQGKVLAEALLPFEVSLQDVQLLPHQIAKCLAH